MMNKYNQVIHDIWRFPSGSGYALQSFVRASQKISLLSLTQKNSAMNRVNVHNYDLKGFEGKIIL
jgi:uncharacterized circularly permuted ATP-grasp superfamily protein